MNIKQSFFAFSRDIKLEHSLFALPFAFIGALSAVRAGAGILTPTKGIMILAAMFFARTAAMGFNRYLDAPLDAANPRTNTRAIPSGRMPRNNALVYSILAGVLFIATSCSINRLAGFLSPLALVIVLGYSTAKRWTSTSHLILGLSLAMAPAGGWIAVSGSLGLPAIVLSAAVLFWVAGFDVLYSLMDIEFDKTNGLYSIPTRFGESKAYVFSRALHIATILLLIAFGQFTKSGPHWNLAVAFTATALIAEQFLARDSRKIPIAFFHINASIGFILLLGII